MSLSNLSVNNSAGDILCVPAELELLPEFVLFHISGVIFLLSYLIPPSLLSGKISFHSGLMLGHFLLTIMSFNLTCSSVMFFCHSSFTIVNIIQIICILYLAREHKFEADIEKVYMELFHPFKISRREFSCLLSSSLASLVSLHPGECYAVAGLSKTDNLALLLAGKCSVLNSQSFLHNIEPGEFLDSPEFESCSSNSRQSRSFQVTVLAGVTSRYISWQRTSLEYLLVKQPRLGHVITALISRKVNRILQDVSRKLFFMTRRMEERTGVVLDIRMMVITGSSHTPRLTRDKSRKIKNNKEETENLNTTSVTTSVTETLDSIVSLEV